MVGASNGLMITREEYGKITQARRDDHRIRRYDDPVEVVSNIIMENPSERIIHTFVQWRSEWHRDNHLRLRNDKDAE